MSKLNKDFLLAILLVIVIVTLFILNIERIRAPNIKEPDNILFDKSTNTLYLNSLTLKQKIAQMVIAYGYEIKNSKEVLQKMFIGGIYLGSKPTKSDFINAINNFQNDSIIPFFVSTDMEGCGNPFERRSRTSQAQGRGLGA